MKKQEEWLQTYSGLKYTILNPNLDEIDILDIAVSLSRQPRFNGHTLIPYFIAQHCVLVAENLNCFRDWGLLHDAAEAYISDIPAPVKRCAKEINNLEEIALKAIAKKFGLEFPIPYCVKEMDLILLATEKRDLMGKEPSNWGELPVPLENKIIPWTMEQCYERFIQVFEIHFGPIENFRGKR